MASGSEGDVSASRVKQYFVRQDDLDHAIRISLALPADASSVETAAAATGARRSFSLVKQSSADMLWGIMEDKLLLKSDDTKSDLVAAYQQCHRVDPVTFPKTQMDMSVMRERIAVVRADSFRRRVVYSFPDEPPSALSSGAQTSIDVPQSGLQRTTSMLGSAPRMVKRAVFTRPDHLFRKEDVVVSCKTRAGGQQGEVSFCSEDLLRYSPFLAVTYRDTPCEPMSNIRRITLDENDSAWAQIPNMHSVFAVDNVKRFLSFCDAPQMLENLLTAEDRVKKAMHDHVADWDAFVNEFEANKDRRLHELKQLRDSEVASMRKRFGDALERDIAVLKEIYEGHVAREEAKLIKRLDLQQKSMEEFFMREKAAIAKVWSRMEDDTVIQRRNERDGIAETCADTFGVEHLPRLLMIADTLKCAELRTNCCKLIAVNFPQHLTNPQYSTRLTHANCLLELASFVSDEHLVNAYRTAKAKGSGHNGFPLDILTVEYESRFKAKMDTLRKMDAIELASLARRVHQWLKRKGKDTKVDTVNGKEEEDEGAAPREGESGNKEGATALEQSRAVTLLDAVTQAMGKLRVQPTVPLFQDGSSMLLQALAKNNLASAIDANMDLLQGVTEEERYAHWKEALYQALQEKQHSYKSEGSCAHLAVVPEFEPFTELSLTKKAVDAMCPFRYACAEGKGCVQVGSSSSKVYMEARIVFVEGGKLYQPNVYIGLNPVARCLNGVQVASLSAALQAGSAEAAGDGDTSRVQQRRGAALASTFITSQAARLASAASPFFSTKERIVGVVPIDVSSTTTPLPLFGFCWTNDGLLYSNGVPFDSRVPYDVGDCVGISVNLLTGAVRLSKNGESVYISAEKIGCGPPVLVPGVSYVPSIAMYSTVLPGLPRSSQANQQAAGFQLAPGDDEANFSAKIRVEVEVEGKARHMPLDHVPFFKASTSAANFQQVADRSIH